MPKMRIEVAVSDDRVEDVVQTIELAARTGLIGDGKIFIAPIERAMRIRTTGDAAL